MNKLSPSPLLEHFYNQVPKGAALDIGFGRGNDSIFLASKGFGVTAIDTKKNNTDDLIRIAKENNLSVKAEMIDVRKFEFRQDAYEIIVAMNSLFFLSGNEFKTIIQNVKKSLKPGG
ncbi:MAG: class I SAM-dependent methyltransferase, partial [Patescibacteria group bacterium]